MKIIRRFVKELKRVRWPSIKDANKIFIKVIIFITIISLALLLFSYAFTEMWNSMGAGLSPK